MLFLTFYSCKKSTTTVFNSVQITPIIEDSSLNIRALELNEKALVAVSSLEIYIVMILESKSL